MHHKGKNKKTHVLDNFQTQRAFMPFLNELKHYFEVRNRVSKIVL